MTTFVEFKDSLQQIQVDEEYCNNFDLYSLTRFTELGNQLYDIKIKEGWSVLNKNKIISELQTKFPEIKDLDIYSLFREDKYPSYIKTDLCKLVKDNLPHKTYLQVSDGIQEYWKENVISQLKKVEEEFESINTLFENKFAVLEKYPKVMEAFQTNDKIKEDVSKTLEELIEFWKQNDYKQLFIRYHALEDRPHLQQLILQQIKEDIFKRIDLTYPVVNREVCCKFGVNDEKLIQMFEQTGRVQLEMLKFGMTMTFGMQTFMDVIKGQ